MWSCEHKGPDHLVYVIIMKKVQIYSKKKVEEFKFVLKIFKYMCLDQKYIYLYHMNSPKMATQVKFHNWTLQERNYFYFPRNFIFSRLLKKECNNWAGGCLGGRSPFMHLTRVMFRESTQKCRMRQENWDFSDLWKIEQNLFVFPQLIHRRSCTLGPNHVKNCIKTSNYMLYQVEHSKLKRHFFQILWKSRCNILVSFPSHLKKLRSILRFWLEKLNCG